MVLPVVSPTSSPEEQFAKNRSGEMHKLLVTLLLPKVNFRLDWTVVYMLASCVLTMMTVQVNCF